MRQHALSLALGYGLAFICAALSVTLFVQRYSAVPQEDLHYRIAEGTRVLIDLRNGKVHEKPRPGPEAAAAARKEEEKTPEAKPEPPPLPETVPDMAGEPLKTVLTADEADFRIDGLPVIAVIVKGLGMSAMSTENALNMPPEVTMGFSPYAPELSHWASKAAARGHDILLHLPMEAGDLSLYDPGPYSMMTGLGTAENLRRMSIVSSLIVRYAGVYTDAKENFSLTGGAVAPVLKELGARGVPMIYGGGFSRHSFFQTAARLMYPVIGADTHIDSVFDEGEARARFEKVKLRAKERGYAAVMVAPYPVTLKLIAELLPAADDGSFRLASVSHLFDALHAEGEDADDTEEPEAGE